MILDEVSVNCVSVRTFLLELFESLIVVKEVFKVEPFPVSFG